jgi:hypothetical protein
MSTRTIGTMTLNIFKYGTQHNDIQPNYTQLNDTHHNDIWCNDTHDNITRYEHDDNRHNDTGHI